MQIFFYSPMDATQRYHNFFEVEVILAVLIISFMWSGDFVRTRTNSSSIMTMPMISSTTVIHFVCLPCVKCSGCVEKVPTGHGLATANCHSAGGMASMSCKIFYFHFEHAPAAFRSSMSSWTISGRRCFAKYINLLISGLRFACTVRG